MTAKKILREVMASVVGIIFFMAYMLFMGFIALLPLALATATVVITAKIILSLF